MTDDFQESLKLGKAIEERVSALMSSKGYSVRVIDTMHRGDLSISGHGLDAFTIEVKGDYVAARTGRVCIELLSNAHTDRPGWALTCRADALAYCVDSPEGWCVYWVRFPALIDALGEWLGKVGARGGYRFGHSLNAGRNLTVSLLVPVRALAAIAWKVEPLP